MAIIRIRTTNDVNGNSRRLWLHIDDATSAPLAVYDEGHQGYAVLPLELRHHVAACPDIIVRPGEFRTMRKEWLAQIQART